jgi:hypothetical protein
MTPLSPSCHPDRRAASLAVPSGGIKTHMSAERPGLCRGPNAKSRLRLSSLTDRTVIPTGGQRFLLPGVEGSRQDFLTERSPSSFRSCTFYSRLSSLATRHSPLATLLLILSLLPSSLPAQNLDKPSLTIDEEITSFAYAPDGRIVFSVRRMFKAKKYDLQRDDIWLMEPGGKRKRIFEGQKFTNDQKLFTYQVESFTWSPNDHIIAVSLFTTSMDPDSGARDDSPALLLLEDSGRELRPNGKDALVAGARFPLWLRDSQNLVYLSNEDTPQGLFSLQSFNIATGPAGKPFEGRTFEGASRISGSNAAIAVERPPHFEGPARLQRLDLLSQEDMEIATLDAYAGGVSVSPSGNLAAYFLDKEVLEIRDLAVPTRVARLRVGLGVLAWSYDESRIYLKRTIEKKSADLVTFQIPPLRSYPPHAEIPVKEPEPAPLLHGLTIREYSLSPDGRSLAVILPGKRNLQIFPF